MGLHHLVGGSTGPGVLHLDKQERNLADKTSFIRLMEPNYDLIVINYYMEGLCNKLFIVVPL